MSPEELRARDLNAIDERAPASTAKKSAAARPVGARNPFGDGALRALRPWAEIFQSTPEAQLRVLGRLVEALAPLIETDDADLRQGRDELDAFDDVAPRGPLERLILSEFLWLKLMPSEFARRVVEQEALRWSPAYRDRADDRAVVLVADCGVAMLGRPRLMALAGVLAIGVSAHREGRRFLWRSTAFDAEPRWQEGLTRRGLSRLVQQTSFAGAPEARLAEALDTLPDGLEKRVIWALGPRSAVEGFKPAAFRLGVRELWRDGTERASTPPNGAPRQEAWAARGRAPLSLEASLREPSGRVRVVSVAPPDEPLAAAILRAPFRAPPELRPSADGASWAPCRLSPDPDGDGFSARTGDTLVFYRRRQANARLILPEGGHLLGVRSAARDVTVIWREAATLHAAQMARSTGEITTRSTLLPEDHPLIAQSHPPGACPPAFRLGKKAYDAVAAPDGQLFSLAPIGGGASGLAVEPAARFDDVRVLAAARNWLLCRRAEPETRLYLAQLRTFQRTALTTPPGDALRAGVRGFLPLDQNVGALAALSDGWIWLGHAREPEPPPPPADADAWLLSTSVQPAPARMGQQPPAAIDRQPVVVANFWSSDQGCFRVTCRAGAWSRRALAAPPLDGAALAVITVAKAVFALTADEDGAERLLEFRLGSRIPAVDTEMFARRPGTTCVEL